VTTFEEKMLSDSLGSLDQAQSADELLKALDRVKSVYTAIATTGIKPGDPLTVGYKPPAAATGTPSKADIEAEMKRRGLMK
jgi:hypothetical protein